MVASTATPGVQRGDVSEEPRRWLLIAALVVAVVPTANAHYYYDCAGFRDTRCRCPYWLNIMTCTLTGDQLPSFLASHKYDIVRIGSPNNSLSVTINAEAFKNLRTKTLEIFSFANITVKPGAFSGVADQLEELKIGRTLRPIPDDIFHGLGQLRLLDLGENRLKTVSRAMFNNFPRLEELFLYRNRLDEIPDDSFDGLTQLKFLDISNNNLKTVTHTMFSHLSRLTNLYLASNKFVTIPDDAFLGLGQLEHLSLESCGLSTLRAPLLRSTTNLGYLSLAYNPLVCDCQLSWVRTAAVDLHGSCTNPPSARDQEITRYNFSQCNQENTGNGCIYFKPPLDVYGSI